VTFPHTGPREGAGPSPQSTSSRYAPYEEDHQGRARNNRGDNDRGLTAIFEWEENRAEHQRRNQDIRP
jgi:hypothetical protein